MSFALTRLYFDQVHFLACCRAHSFYCVQTCLLIKLTKTNPRSLNVTILSFLDVQNYCATCREAGKGDDPCVTLLSPCEICSSFTEEQLTKITHRKRYVKRADKKSDKTDKNDDLGAELLGNNSIEPLGGSHAELEVADEHLFTSPPQPQPLSFEALSHQMLALTVPKLHFSAEEPSWVASTSPKKSSHSHKQYDVVLSSALDHYSDSSDDPQPASSRPLII